MSTETRRAGLYLEAVVHRLWTPVVTTAVQRVSPTCSPQSGCSAARRGREPASRSGWWPLAALFMVLRLAGANLDGAVARAAGRSRPWGFVLNGRRPGVGSAGVRRSGWRSGPHGRTDPGSTGCLAGDHGAGGRAGLDRADVRRTGRGRRRARRGQRWPAGQNRALPGRGRGRHPLPVVLPVASIRQLINGSLLTAALRLRAAHRELTIKPADPQPAAVAGRIDLAGVRRPQPEKARKKCHAVAPGSTVTARQHHWKGTAHAYRTQSRRTVALAAGFTTPSLFDVSGRPVADPGPGAHRSSRGPRRSYRAQLGGPAWTMTWPGS